jgi:hypothetical protein
MKLGLQLSIDFEGYIRFKKQFCVCPTSKEASRFVQRFLHVPVLCSRVKSLLIETDSEFLPFDFLIPWVNFDCSHVFLVTLFLCWGKWKFFVIGDGEYG